MKPLIENNENGKIEIYEYVTENEPNSVGNPTTRIMRIK